MFFAESLKRVQMRNILNTQIRNMKYELWPYTIGHSTRFLDRKFKKEQPGQIQNTQI